MQITEELRVMLRHRGINVSLIHLNNQLIDIYRYTRKKRCQIPPETSDKLRQATWLINSAIDEVEELYNAKGIFENVYSNM